MAVIKINIGPKVVALTAYCPDDELGLAACAFVLARVRELFATPPTSAELRDYLIGKDAGWADVFARLDAGWRLPKNPPFTIDPSNAAAESRIAMALADEMAAQRRMTNGQRV